MIDYNKQLDMLSVYMKYWISLYGFNRMSFDDFCNSRCSSNGGYHYNNFIVKNNLKFELKPDTDKDRIVFLAQKYYDDGVRKYLIDQLL